MTHLHENNTAWIIGTPFDTLEHFVLYDYAIHWIDITRCWLGNKTIAAVRALDFRTPQQSPEAHSPRGAWIELLCDDGTAATIRAIGCAEVREPTHPFWIHGSKGAIRGSVLGRDWVELENRHGVQRFTLEGAWFPDGFAGTMGELLCAIAEDREPFNSLEHNLLSLQITLAACRSAEEGGRPVRIDEV